jgi:hypothetical protein
MLVVAAALVAAEVTPPPFPSYTSQFNMSESIWMNDSGAPTSKRQFLWDQVAGRSAFTSTTLSSSTFELQLRRCDLTPQVYWDIRGDATADPSSFTCLSMTAKPGYPISVCNPGFPFLPDFWLPPASAHWNGTDTINGVQCDRFNFQNSAGRTSFWGTPTQPCRSDVTSISGSQFRMDYRTFVPGAPPAAGFEPPSWLNELKCRPVATAAELPPVSQLLL